MNFAGGGGGSPHRDPRMIQYSIVSLPVFLALRLASAISAFPLIWILCHFFSTSSTERLVEEVALMASVIFPQVSLFLTVVTPAPNLDLSTLLFSSTNLLRYKHSSVVQFGFLFFGTLHVGPSSLFSAIFNAGQKQTIISRSDYPYYKNHKHNKT